MTLTDTGDGTEIAYRYEAEISGKVASVGGRLLDGAAKVVIGEFFRALARHCGGGAGNGPIARLRELLNRIAKGGRT